MPVVEGGGSLGGAANLSGADTLAATCRLSCCAGMNFIHVPELDVNPPLSPGSVLARQSRPRLGSASCWLQECDRRRIREGKDNVMFRKSIIALAAVATLGLAALASGPASARGHFGGHFGGHMRMGGIHRMGGFHQMAFRHRF